MSRQKKITQEEFDKIKTMYDPEGISLEEFHARLSPPRDDARHLPTPPNATRKRKRKSPSPSPSPKRPSPNRDDDDFKLLNEYEGGKKKSNSKKSKSRKSKSKKSKK